MGASSSARSLKPRPARMHANPVRGASRAPAAPTLPLYSDSHEPGTPVNSAVERESASRLAIRHVAAQLGWSDKVLAHNAGVAASAWSDAFNKRQRNLEIDWIYAQGAQFVALYQAEVNRLLGLTHEAQRQESFEAVVAVLRAIWFRPRAERMTPEDR